MASDDHVHPVFRNWCCKLYSIAKLTPFVKLFIFTARQECVLEEGGKLIVGDEVKSEDGGAVRAHGSVPGTQSVVGWWTSAWELTTQGLWFYWFLKQLSVQFDHARRAAEALVKPLMPVQRVPDRPHFMATFCCTEMAGCDACGLWDFPFWSGETPESATW